MRITILKSFPQFSDDIFFAVIGNALKRFEMSVLKQYIPIDTHMKSPSAKLTYTHIEIVDFEQCDQSYIAIIFGNGSATVLNQHTLVTLYKIPPEAFNGVKFIFMPQLSVSFSDLPAFLCAKKGRLELANVQNTGLSKYCTLE